VPCISMQSSFAILSSKIMIFLTALFAAINEKRANYSRF